MLDGQGYETDSGTHGHRGYANGDYRFALLAATTPLSPAAWEDLGKFGNRIVQLETGYEKPEIDELVASIIDPAGHLKVGACAEATSNPESTEGHRMDGVRAAEGGG